MVKHVGGNPMLYGAFGAAYANVGNPVLHGAFGAAMVPNDQIIKELMT